MFHNGDEEGGKKSFKPLFDLEPAMTNAGMRPYEGLNSQMNNEQAHGHLAYVCGATQVRPAHEVVHRVWETLHEMMTSRPMFKPTMVVFEYYHLDKIDSVPKDRTAYNCRGNHNSVMLMVKWVGEKDMVAEAREWAHKITGVIDDGSGAAEIPYGNFGESPHADHDSWRGLIDRYTESGVDAGASKVLKYYGSNYPRLQKVKAKYDPNCVFNRWFPIQPEA